MIISATQRKTRFIVSDDRFHAAEYEVAPLAEKTAKEFVTANHYAASYPSARRRFGLFWFGQLVGAAIFSHPVNNAVLTNAFDCTATEAVELGRFVLLDEVPFNAESWFFTRCKELLKKEGFAGIVSFSDDAVRTDLNGRIVFKGHLGIIYQATSAGYVGRGSKSRSLILPDGLILSPRAISKVRGDESGADYVCRRLIKFAASPMPVAAGQRKLWFEHELKLQTRIFRHPGCHKYLWKLDRRVKIKNRILAYPRISDNLLLPLINRTAP